MDKAGKNETLGLIDSLRTVHGNFSCEIIPEDKIEAIIDAALRAANASARQSYSIVVIDDKERMNSLFSYSGSHALVFCVDYTRLNETARHMGYEFDNDNVTGFVTGSVDTILAAQTAVIAAKSLGIDSLITNGLHRKSLDAAYELLKLPQTSCFPLIAVVFGYASGSGEPIKGRLDKKFLVFRNEYRNLTDAEIAQSIAEYDDRDKRIGLTQEWEKMGYAHYLEWFFEKWTGSPDPEKKLTGKIKEMQERLVKSGFWYNR